MDREISMIDAVLKFRDAVVKDAMTSDVFMLSMDDRFSFEVRMTGNDIFSSCKMFY
jgi:CBS domain containing-hemolysin-like protein